MAPLIQPAGLAVDARGAVYVSDRATHTIYRVDPGGAVRTLAGAGVAGYIGDGGPAAASRLAFPEGIALDRRGRLYVADRGNHCVRLIDTRTGIIGTIAGDGFAGNYGDGGRARVARLRDPVAVAVDRWGHLLIADLGNSRVRRVDGRTGIITTLAGLTDVAATSVASGPDGAVLATDASRRRIVRRDRKGGVETIAGNGGLGYVGDGGLAVNAHLSRPMALARDQEGNLYIADADANRVRRVEVTTGLITTVAGTGLGGYSGDEGPAAAASLRAPEAVAPDDRGRLLIADTGNHRIRCVSKDGVVSTLAGNGEDGSGGDGPARDARIGFPTGLAVDQDGGVIVVQGRYGLIHRIDPTTGALRTIAGRPASQPVADGQPATSGSIPRISAFAVSPAGDLLFAEEDTLRVRRINGRTGIVSAEAGRGLGAPTGDPTDASSVALGTVMSLAIVGVGDVLFGEVPGTIRRLDATRRQLTQVFAAKPRYLQPSAILPVEAGALLIADSTGWVLRLEPEGRLVPVAGGGFGF